MNPYYQNLHQLVKNYRTLSMSERLTICYKISKGLCFLGSKSVLHRDFKPQNVMIDKFFSPFIIDFGSCAPIHKSSGFTIKESRRTFAFTQSYQPNYFISNIIKYQSSMSTFITNLLQTSTIFIPCLTCIVLVELSAIYFSIRFIHQIQKIFQQGRTLNY